MLEQNTLDKIQELKLYGMLDALKHINDTDKLHALTLHEGLGLLTDWEIAHRTNKRLHNLLKAAKLRYPQAMVEDIKSDHKRALTPELLRWMISGQWLAKYQNIVLVGPTGIGKTYLACACAQLACRQGINTRYFRLSKLLEALRIAH